MVVVNKKNFQWILRLLDGDRELSVEERILYARSMAMTPDERWQAHENFLRSHGLLTRSQRKAYGFK